jgi:hypothetical protein
MPAKRLPAADEPTLRVERHADELSPLHMDRLDDATLARALARVTAIARELVKVDPAAALLVTDLVELAGEVLANRNGARS